MSFFLWLRNVVLMLAGLLVGGTILTIPVLWLVKLAAQRFHWSRDALLAGSIVSALGLFKAMLDHNRRLALGLYWLFFILTMLLAYSG